MLQTLEVVCFEVTEQARTLELCVDHSHEVVVIEVERNVSFALWALLEVEALLAHPAPTTQAVAQYEHFGALCALQVEFVLKWLQSLWQHELEVNVQVHVVFSVS